MIFNLVIVYNKTWFEAMNCVSFAYFFVCIHLYLKVVKLEDKYFTVSIGQPCNTGSGLPQI